MCPQGTDSRFVMLLSTVTHQSTDGLKIIHQQNFRAQDVTEDD